MLRIGRILIVLTSTLVAGWVWFAGAMPVVAVGTQLPNKEDASQTGTAQIRLPENTRPMN